MPDGECRVGMKKIGIWGEKIRGGKGFWDQGRNSGVRAGIWGQDLGSDLGLGQVFGSDQGFGVRAVFGVRAGIWGQVLGSLIPGVSPFPADPLGFVFDTRSGAVRAQGGCSESIREKVPETPNAKFLQIPNPPIPANPKSQIPANPKFLQIPNSQSLQVPNSQFLQIPNSQNFNAQNSQIPNLQNSQMPNAQNSQMSKFPIPRIPRISKQGFFSPWFSQGFFPVFSTFFPMDFPSFSISPS